MHYLNNKREEITVNIEQWTVILSLVLCVHQFGFWNIQMHQNNLTQFMIKCIRVTWMNTENVALQTARPLFMGNLKDLFNPHCHLKCETFAFFNQNFEIYTSWGDYSKVLTSHSAQSQPIIALETELLRKNTTLTSQCKRFRDLETGRVFYCLECQKQPVFSHLCLWSGWSL